MEKSLEELSVVQLLLHMNHHWAVTSLTFFLRLSFHCKLYASLYCGIFLSFA